MQPMFQDFERSRNQMKDEMPFEGINYRYELFAHFSFMLIVSKKKNTRFVSVLCLLSYF